MNNIDINLFGDKCFSVDDVVRILKENGKRVSVSNIKKEINLKLKNNQIIRIGRSRYIYNHENKKVYKHYYSKESLNINKTINDKFPTVNYSIYESIQLNEFLNHQIAHNTIFVSVEKDLEKHVFELLKDKFPGRVLLNPNKEEYDKYWKDNLIIINKLITEAPLNKNNNFEVKIEKLLVDLYKNKIESLEFSKSELPNIYAEAFNKYIIDESSLFRYARRRNAEEKIKKFIKEEVIC